MKTKKTTIKENGKNEYDLQDKIALNPSVLNSLFNTELHTIEKELQTPYGNIDIILENNNNELFVVETMQGNSDRDHRCRLNDYVLYYKHINPNKNVKAVLIAEKFPNIEQIALNSMNIDAIIVSINNNEFNYKRLNTENAEFDTTAKTSSNKKVWAEKDACTLKIATDFNIHSYFVNYNKSYISIGYGSTRYTFTKSNKFNHVLIAFHVKDETKATAIKNVLNENEVLYRYKNDKYFEINSNGNINTEMYNEIDAIR